MLKAIAPGHSSGGSGVSSLNSETGDLTLTSSGGSINITTPTSDTINLEALAVGMLQALTCSIPGTNPTNQTLVADSKAAFGYVINSIRGGKTSSGSITLSVKINGTAVIGLGAINLTSAPADTNATAANTVVAGDAVTWVFSSNSSAQDVAFTMKITRT